MAEISSSLEDYLETILLLEKENKKVRVTDIADRLHLSKPSVNRAVTNLKACGYINHESYGGITLTPCGRKAAAQVFHRHNLLKTFLVDVLGVDEETSEQDACRMEHVISCQTVEKLCAFLSNEGYYENE